MTSQSLENRLVSKLRDMGIKNEGSEYCSGNSKTYVYRRSFGN